MVVLGDPVDGSNPGRGPRFIPVSSGIYRKVPQSARVCKAVRPFDTQLPRPSLYLTVDVRDLSFSVQEAGFQVGEMREGGAWTDYTNGICTFWRGVKA